MWYFFLPLCVAILSIVFGGFRKRKCYPPGPIPLPIIGNLLSFALNKDAMKVIRNYAKEYGPVCTVWFGDKPHVVVSDWDLVKEALGRNEFNHRPPTVLSGLLLPKGSDIFISSPSPEFHVLRRTLSSTLRIFLNGKKMENVTNKILNEAIEERLKAGDTIDGEQFAKSVIFVIMSEIAFSPKNETEANEALGIFGKTLDLFTELAGNGCLSDYLPIFRPFFRRKEKTIAKAVLDCSNFLMKKCADHRADFQTGDIKDLVGAVLKATDEVSQDDRKYLHDHNLSYLLIDMFFGGTDTALISLSWIMLFLAKYPKYQEKIQAEIATQIGDREPEKEDMKRCDYTLAFMMDLWRLRVIGAFLLPHYNKESAVLGEYNLPAGTGILFDVGAFQSDSKYWPNPDELVPERYLDENGKLSNIRPNHYATFGMGNRACVGEKFAKFELFLILTTLMQKCNLVLESRVDRILDRKLITITCEPKPFQIKFTRRT